MEKAIIITGAAGFIGSVLTGKLNQTGEKNLILVDDFSRKEKEQNIENKDFIHKIHRDHFSDWLDEHGQRVEFLFHIGARTNTAEFDVTVFNKLNLGYSKMIWEKCVHHKIPLIYASSAATYGMGELGYDDRHEIIPNLKPLNPYGESKNEFDKWVLMQKSVPPFWAGFKFFNVYGPNEYHKNRMASVIFHTYNQILKNGKMLLFKSHHPDFENGKQMRDFVYVKDLVNILIWFMQNKPTSGIYNLGTGKARTFLDLVNAVFDAVNIEPKIEFIDTPLDIRDKYQYFTQANMVKTIGTGYKKQFFSLEEGVNDYVKNYLIDQRFLNCDRIFLIYIIEIVLLQTHKRYRINNLA